MQGACKILVRIELAVAIATSEESTNTRKAGGLDFRPKSGKTKARRALIVAVVTGCIAPGL